MDSYQELTRVGSSTSFSLTLPTFKTTQGNKLDHLYDFTTLSDNQKIDETNLPIVNPYHVFTKQTFFLYF